MVARVELETADKIKFIDYWDNLPTILTIEDTDFYEKIFNHIRGHVVYILREGVDDTQPETSKKIKRRVLSASEIKDRLEEIMGQPIKKANLYFHLQKLEDAGFVKNVASISRGKRTTTFYGRTAKAYSPKYEKKSMSDFHKTDELKQFIHVLNPEIDSQEVEDVIASIDSFNYYYHDQFEKWLERDPDIIQGLDIDIVELSNFMDVISRYSPNVFSGIAKLAKLLGVEQIVPDYRGS